MGKYGDTAINLLDDVPPFKATILLANLSLRQLSKKTMYGDLKYIKQMGFMDKVQ